MFHYAIKSPRILTFLNAGPVPVDVRAEELSPFVKVGADGFLNLISGGGHIWDELKMVDTEIQATLQCCYFLEDAVSQLGGTDVIWNGSVPLPAG